MAEKKVKALTEATTVAATPEQAEKPVEKVTEKKTAAKKTAAKPKTTVRTKKVPNSNGMREALVLAHNSNNSKAIDNKMCEQAGVDKSVFDQWCIEVAGNQPDGMVLMESGEKYPSLYRVVKDYVDVKLSKDARIKTDEKMAETYNAIFPVWRELLQSGEKGLYTCEIKVEKDDVESLIGYMEIFVPTARGTQRSVESKAIFRKWVEALLGWKMAKNEALTEDEALIVTGYEKAVSSRDTTKDTIADFKKRIKFFEHKISEVKSDEFKEYLTGILNDLKHGKKQVQPNGTAKVVEAGLEQAEAKLKETEEFITKNSDKYLEIIGKLEYLK